MNSHYKLTDKRT